MRVSLAALPVVVYLLAAYQLFPKAHSSAPVRLALVRAAVVVAGYAVVLVEVLSAVDALTLPALLTGWSVAALTLFAAAVRRYRHEGRRRDPRAGLRASWAAATPAERTMSVALVGLVIAELLVALVSPPNNFDSQTYHLPKIEHWVVQQDVDFYPTVIHRQLSMAPGAEYLLLHLRLLTGGDEAYNVLQFAAGVGCALLASRIAGQLGGTRRAQLLAAFVVATTPIVALEATSTQTDLVLAAWVGCVATLVLDEMDRTTRVSNLALIGAASGLAMLTKATGLIAVGPLFLLWLIAQLRRGVWSALAGGVAIGAVALCVTGPYLYRVNDAYGSLLGPDNLRNMITMQRHDPPSVLVNALRIGETALQTPIGPLNDQTAAGIRRLSRAMGVDPDDPQITYPGSTYPYLSWPPDEDRVSFPVQGTLVLLGAGYLLVRPRRRVPAEHAARARVYDVVFWLALLGYVTMVKWQPWGNRLVLFVLVLGTPLAGLWLDALFRRSSVAAAGGGPADVAPAGPPRDPIRRLGAWTAATALVVGGCAGWLAVGYGWPRRLVGTDSVFTLTDTQARFIRRPQWQADYEWAATGVHAAGAHRIGLVQGYNTWEYPWWVLLRGSEIVSLQSLQDDTPPVAPETVDAIVCVSPPNPCANFVPPGWTLQTRNGIGYALPPRR
jgi:hypothetical protein